MQFVDHAFIERIEQAHTSGFARNVHSFHKLFPEERCGHLQIAGGHVFFADMDSSICRAFGIGLNGAVSSADLDKIEEFFRQYESPARVVLCPFTDKSLLKLLRERSYSVKSFNQSLVREVSTSEELLPLPEGVEVRLAQPDEGQVWAETVCEGFNIGGVPLHRSVGDALFHEDISEKWLAFFHGEPAGAASVDFHDGCAICAVGSVKSEFRQQGIHTSLISARLVSAARHHCDLILMITDPGTISQRNAQKFGFQVVCTRTVVEQKI
jgi:hypothetical protein